MKGKHHLILSFLSLLILILPFLPAIPPFWWVGIGAATLVGSLAPDVDAPDAAIFHLRKMPKWIRLLLAFFGYLLRYTIYLPLSFVFWVGLGRNYRHEHRGLLHTPLGITLASLLLLLYAGILSHLLFPPLRIELLLFGGAFWGGCLLHLLQDSCTPAGIAWGFPVYDSRLRGGIRTEGRHDPRPLLFAVTLAFCLILTLTLPKGFFLPPWIFASLLLAGAWYLFLFLARKHPNVLLSSRANG